MRTAPQRQELHVPTTTLVKLALFALVSWALVKLWPELVYLGLSLLFAVALAPLVNRMTGLGLGRSHSVFLLAIVLLAIVLLVIIFLLPPLFEQARQIADDFPTFRERAQQHLPESPVLRSVISKLLLLPTTPEVARELNQPLVWGQRALSGGTTTVLVITIALYFVVDGRRLYAWLLAYVPRRHRAKVARTVPEVTEVVFAYARGQLITSLLFASFAAGVLWYLRVPAWLPLALLAGLCDVLPVVGIVIATAPAVLMALAVAPKVALAVTALYAGYHLLEAYVIVPHVYGKSLRLSTLSVLLALVIGGALQGVIGAVLVLPLVAAYPIVERIWLKEYLAPEVIQDHSALARAAETGRDTAIDAVLNGEEQPISRRF